MSASDHYERTARARSLRREASPPERILWRHRRKRQVAGLRFRRQHPIGPYFADFACVAARLVIEVDGRAHSGDRWDRDRQRDAFMRDQGWEVVRISASLLAKDLDGALAMIARVGAARAQDLEKQ